MDENLEIKTVGCNEYIVVSTIYVKNNRQNHFEGVIQPNHKNTSLRRRSKNVFLIPNGDGKFPNLKGINGVVNEFDSNTTLSNFMFKKVDSEEFFVQKIMPNYRCKEELNIIEDLPNYDADNQFYYRKPMLESELSFPNLSFTNMDHFIEISKSERFVRNNINFLKRTFNVEPIREIVYAEDYAVVSEFYKVVYDFSYDLEVKFLSAFLLFKELRYAKFKISNSKDKFDFGKRNEKYRNFIPFIKLVKSSGIINKFGDFDNNSFDYIFDVTMDER